jgi:hypothetical protein
LASRANAQTTVIVAEPSFVTEEDLKAVREIAARGGRVLLTGSVGGRLAPGGSVRSSTQFQSLCKLAPQGLDPLAASGEVWIAPQAGWAQERPRDRVEYNCAGEPAVVEYAESKGQIIWWASATPLENDSIARAENLNLFLNSLGPREGHRFYWDESLHGEARTQWFYARGPAMNLLLLGFAGITLLILFSFSRRRGPVRDLPAPPRATPVEFLEALGSLYAEAGAAATAVEIACERFRRRTGQWCGIKTAQMNAEELCRALRQRFPQAGESLEADLDNCEAAIKDDKLSPKRALSLVQALHRHGDALEAAMRTKIQPRQPSRPSSNA